MPQPSKPSPRPNMMSTAKSVEHETEGMDSARCPECETPLIKGRTGKEHCLNCDTVTDPDNDNDSAANDPDMDE